MAESGRRLAINRTIKDVTSEQISATRESCDDAFRDRLYRESTCGSINSSQIRGYADQGGNRAYGSVDFCREDLLLVDLTLKDAVVHHESLLRVDSLWIDLTSETQC